MPVPTPLSPTSALGLVQCVWMGGFQVGSSRPPVYWLMSGQVCRSRAPGRPQGGVRPRGEGTEGPVAGPTLAGTLETCVLGGSQAQSSELEGMKGCRETRNQTTCGHHTQGLCSRMPTPPVTLQKPACLPQQGSPFSLGRVRRAKLAPKQALQECQGVREARATTHVQCLGETGGTAPSTALSSGKGASAHLSSSRSEQGRAGKIVHPRGIVSDTPGWAAMESR